MTDQNNSPYPPEEIPSQQPLGDQGQPYGGAQAYQLPPIPPQGTTSYPYTPPPPAQKSNRTWIIVAVVVVLLLCCCCVAGLGYFAWTNGDSLMNPGNYQLLPAIQNLFQ